MYVCCCVFDCQVLLPSSLSHSGSYMLVGAENGNVRAFPLHESAATPGLYDIGNFISHWTLSIHDNQYGQVTHICCSHDDKYILTAGHDGNVFVFQASLEVGLKKKEVEHLGDTKVSRMGIYVRTYV